MSEFKPWFQEYLKSNPQAALAAGTKKVNKKSALANYMQAQQAMQYALAERQMKLGLGDIQKGYGGAIANAGLGAEASRVDAQKALQANLGGINQAAVDKGLYGSTVQGAMNRGAYSDHATNLAQINQGLAQTLSQLQMARANAVAGARGGLAGLYQEREAAGTGLNSMLFKSLAQQKKKKSAIGSTIGSLAGSFLGPIGSAAGGALGGAIFGGGGGYTGMGSLNYPGS